MNTWCRGVRGATTATDNTREAILEATRDLLLQMISLNGIEAADVASAIFTTTPDLNAEFPALAARELGWHDTALLCGHEMSVPGSLQRCVRILVHWNTTRSAAEIVHVYLREARSLRPEHAQMSALSPAAEVPAE
jgi:chorismate mutase